MTSPESPPSIDKIMEKLYFSKSHRDYCRTLCNKDLDAAEDLFGDSIADLLEKGEEKIQKVYSNGKMETYFACVIRYKHLSRMKKEKLWEKYVDWEETTSTDSQVERVETRMDYMTVEKALGELYFYHRGLLLLYLEHESYKKVSQITKIPYYSVFFGVREARKMLKKIVYGI